MGHRDTRTHGCALHGKSKEIKDMATKVTMGELIAIEVFCMKEEGKQSC